MPERGAYIELQAGVAPTQNQEFILGAGETLEWTECISPVAVDPAIGHNPDYDVACAAMEQKILEQVPDGVLAEQDAWMSTQATRPTSQILCQGRAWGMLHERMTDSRISPALTFDVEPAEEACWADLLTSGSFSADMLTQNPRSWAVSDRWADVLKRSVESYGATWLHELFLGVINLDRGQRTQAKEHFQRSLALRDNYLANRHLALIEVLDGEISSAWSIYQDAWAKSDGNTHLAVEICQFLRENDLSEELTDFVTQLPLETREHERIRLAQAEVALLQGDHAQVLDILDGDFASIREGETLLTDLWFAVHRSEAKRMKGEPLSPHEIADVDRLNPPPHRIDFRMKIDMATGDN